MEYVYVDFLKRENNTDREYFNQTNYVTWNDTYLSYTHIENFYVSGNKYVRNFTCYTNKWGLILSFNATSAKIRPTSVKIYTTKATVIPEKKEIFRRKGGNLCSIL